MSDTQSYPTRSTYLNEDDFFEDGVLGGVRSNSGERDFGVWWKETDRSHPVYRVSHIVDTNEIVAVCLGGAPRGQIELLASGITTEQADEALKGWAEICGQSYSLPWVRRHLEGYPPKVG